MSPTQLTCCAFCHLPTTRRVTVCVGSGSVWETVFAAGTLHYVYVCLNCPSNSRLNEEYPFRLCSIEGWANKPPETGARSEIVRALEDMKAACLDMDAPAFIKMSTAFIDAFLRLYTR